MSGFQTQAVKPRPVTNQPEQAVGGASIAVDKAYILGKKAGFAIKNLRPEDRVFISDYSPGRMNPRAAAEEANVKLTKPVPLNLGKQVDRLKEVATDFSPIKVAKALSAYKLIAVLEPELARLAKAAENEQALVGAA